MCRGLKRKPTNFNLVNFTVRSIHNCGRLTTHKTLYLPQSFTLKIIIRNEIAKYSISDRNRRKHQRSLVNAENCIISVTKVTNPQISKTTWFYLYCAMGSAWDCGKFRLPLHTWNSLLMNECWYCHGGFFLRNLKAAVLLRFKSK